MKTKNKIEEIINDIDTICYKTKDINIINELNSIIKKIYSVKADILLSQNETQNAPKL